MHFGPFSILGYSAGFGTLLSTSFLAREPVHVVSQRLGHASPVVTMTVCAHVCLVISVKPQTCSHSWSGRLHGDKCQRSATAAIRGEFSLLTCTDAVSEERVEPFAYAGMLSTDFLVGGMS
jgi:hypothetical protein